MLEITPGHQRRFVFLVHGLSWDDGRFAFDLAGGLMIPGLVGNYSRIFQGLP